MRRTVTQLRQAMLRVSNEAWFDCYWPLWPLEWGISLIWTGSGPPLGLSGSGRHGYWCRHNPHGTGSPPRHQRLSWSPQTPESVSPCLGAETKGQNLTDSLSIKKITSSQDDSPEQTSHLRLQIVKFMLRHQRGAHIITITKNDNRASLSSHIQVYNKWNRPINMFQAKAKGKRCVEPFSNVP